MPPGVELLPVALESPPEATDVVAEVLTRATKLLDKTISRALSSQVVVAMRSPCEEHTRNTDTRSNPFLLSKHVYRRFSEIERDRDRKRFAVRAKSAAGRAFEATDTPHPFLHKHRRAFLSEFERLAVVLGTRLAPLREYRKHTDKSLLSKHDVALEARAISGSRPLKDCC